MILSYLYAFLSVLVVSFVSLTGVLAISIKERLIRKYIFIFISLAVGALLGDVFIHIVPEVFESSFNPVVSSILLIAGVMIFFTLEKFLHWHHHGEDENDFHIHPVGKLVLFSDGVHNLIDGVIIGASFFVSVPVGIATTLAVVFHEIPQEIGDFSVLIHAGYEIPKALWFNFLSALVAFLGLGIAFILGQLGQYFIMWVLPLTAGGFIYIALTDLIPELHKTKEIKHVIFQIISVCIGVLIMAALVFIE